MPVAQGQVIQSRPGGGVPRDREFQVVPADPFEGAVGQADADFGGGFYRYPGVGSFRENFSRTGQG